MSEQILGEKTELHVRIEAPSSQNGNKGLEKLLEVMRTAGIASNICKNYSQNEKDVSTLSLRLDLLTQFDDYLGSWKGGKLELRKRVGQYMFYLCDVFQKRLDVGVQLLHDSKKRPENATFARNVAALFLAIAYEDELSQVEIGEILMLEHAIVNKAPSRFPKLTLKLEDLQYINKALDACYQTYIGRKPTLRMI